VKEIVNQGVKYVSEVLEYLKATIKINKKLKKQSMIKAGYIVEI